MSDLTDAPPRQAADNSSRAAGHGAFTWFELMTPDPAAAKRFYDAVVGWDIEPEPSGAMEYRMIRRADGGNAGGMLTLTDEMRAGGARPAWFGYLAVGDVDAAVDAVVADGGQSLMAARDISDGLRIAMVADPQGAPVYLMRTTSEGVSDVFDPMRPQHVRWNELSTRDPVAAIDFYKRHFGWAQEGGMDMGEMGQYQFVQQGDVGIGAIMPLMPGMPHAVWSFYIGVDDIDRAARAITDGGGTIIQDPMEIPGGEHALNATDPQGARFGLVGPRK
jgi:predicted enzyme related to lactoylglutathione lyase